MNEPQRFFVCSLGTQNRPAIYAADDRKVESRFSAAGVARLFDFGPGVQALLLLTPEAAEHAPPLVGELGSLGLGVRELHIPRGETEDEMLLAVEKLVEAVPESGEVDFDVTAGLRHLSFVYFLALTYLTVLRGVQVRGIYYGAYELGTTDTEGRRVTPVFDLSPFFGLVEWYAALALARESGNWSAIARQLRAEARSLFARVRDFAREIDLSALAQIVSRLGPALRSGLPIEAGIHAAELEERLDRALERWEKEPHRALAAKLALASLRSEVPRWKLPRKLKKKEEKRNLPLEPEELRREAELARWHFEQGAFDKAVLLARELLVSAVLHRQRPGAGWLDYGARKPAEMYLSGIAARCEAGVAQPEEERLGKLWQRLARLRNNLAHAGMTNDFVAPSAGEVEEILAEVSFFLEEGALDFVARGTPMGELLVTPCGLSPGVLYSALVHLRPARVVVVVSKDSKSAIEEALERAESRDIAVKTIELSDPYRDYEGPPVDRELREWIVGSPEVVVNVTGGTTAMQIVVEKIGDEARRLGVPTRRVALVDRRTPEEQRREPYVLGELLDLSPRRSGEASPDEGLDVP